ncbi:MAG: glycoside hydrolase family 9 protein [Spirochaetales bacterium]|nr:glycoside hydrolase family 9 protein [Spirochaetales bacterium]
MLFEMEHGADFLLKMQNEEGWFYKTLFDRWSKDPEERMLCSYKTQQGERLDTMKAGFREGGGMACAALAAASRTAGDTKKALYLQAAAAGYSWLKDHNDAALEGGPENLIDWYCALSAALQLERSDAAGSYREDILYWTEKISAAFHHFSDSEGWWFVQPEEKVPFYHASDEGLLLLTLKESCDFLEKPDRESVEGMLSRASAFLTNRLLADPDPFYYPRHWVEGTDSPVYKWFYPHSNPSGYWWQGENSRISSLGAAVLSLQDDSRLGLSVLDWQLGLNPFNVSMVDGWGAVSPEYEGDYYNLAGGVANGITSGFEDEEDIAFQPELTGNPGDNAWRWGEQWIPHAAWFMLLCSLLREKGL